ncbi:MAG: UDP-N-acetylmuramoyl-tripeptide--D-alanyl-D-alanine ligase [Ignavibacteriaceae bacterium]
MKKLNLTLQDFFDLPTAVIYNPDNFKPVTLVSIDSRNISKNSLFVAIKGEKLDGHKFVRDAIKNGASVVVIDKKNYKGFSDLEIPVVTVQDTTKALGDLAKAWRKKLRAKIIGITGSNGKTSTKEILSILLSQKYSVNKTLANHNNHIGVPLTLFSTNQKHDVLVAELGTNHFGEIKYTAAILQPDYALITNIGDSHLEFFKDRKGVLKEKSALFDETASSDGTVIVNNDDKLLKEYCKRFQKKITFSLSDVSSNVKGKISGYLVDGRYVIEVEYKKQKMNFILPVYGESSVKNFIASLAIGLNLGLNENQITDGLKNLKPVDKRLNVEKFKSFILIDDTYNANPESMISAFNLMGKISWYENKIAILGDMFELGADSVKLHKSLAEFIIKNKIDAVYTIGSLMKNLNQSLQKRKIETKHFNDRQTLKKFLSKKDFSYSIILVKGSRGMKMEEFVQTIEAKAND